MTANHENTPARAPARWQESSAGMAVLGDSIPVLGKRDLSAVANDNKPRKVPSRSLCRQAGFFVPY
jgi:hypothetical protein